MGDRISIDCSMPDLFPDIDTAISVGLVTNELLTNSLKYAFVGRDAGTVRISLTGWTTILSCYRWPTMV